MKTLVSIKKESRAKPKITVLLWFSMMLLPLLVLAEYIRQYYFFFHTLLLFTGGLGWTCTEYFFHRFIMHDSDHSKGLARLLNHKHHHTDPSDIRVTTPHRIMMITGTVALIIISIVLNNYFTLVCGYFAGFTVFCLVHVVLHQPWSKRTFPQLHRFHVQHHCKQSDKCFGVTLTWWDHLFGTVPAEEKKISNRVLEFYYKKEKQEKNVISLNNIMDEKIQLTDKRSA